MRKEVDELESVVRQLKMNFRETFRDVRIPSIIRSSPYMFVIIEYIAANL